MLCRSISAARAAEAVKVSCRLRAAQGVMHTCGQVEAEKILDVRAQDAVLMLMF